MNSDRSNSKPFIEPVTAWAGAGLSLVLAAGFLSFAAHALASGCIRLKAGPHAAGVAHCRPEPAYWVASVAFLVFGCGLALVCGKLFQIAKTKRGSP